MSEAIVVAIITGACAIAAQLIISNRSSKELYAKLDKQSEIKDTELKGEIAVIRSEISNLRKTVEKHNSVIERTFILEKDVARLEDEDKRLNERLKIVEGK